MAGKRQRSNGTWEYVFKRKGVLPTPVYFTFDTEEEGDAYAKRAEELLEKGVVPSEMRNGCVGTLRGLIELYEATVSMADSERDLLPILAKLVDKTRVEVVNYDWVEHLVARLRADNRAPSTITKRISGIARVVDWAMRKNMVSFVSNPFRMLPKGYANSVHDRNRLWDGERDRRLEEGEEGRIRVVLSGPELLLFDIALETTMRMGEIVTLRTKDIDLSRSTIFLFKTKNGSRRQVPISSVLKKLLEAENLSAREWLFPDWWQGGDRAARQKLSNKLSHLYAKRFSKAGVEGLHFHDLRHEATSRLYERTQMSDLKIASITGHKGFRMLQRYANLRGSTLASEMW